MIKLIIALMFAAVAANAGPLINANQINSVGKLVISSGVFTSSGALVYSLSLSSGINMPLGTVKAAVLIGDGSGITNLTAGLGSFAPVGVATASLQTQVYAVGQDTASASSRLVQVAASTASEQTQIYSLGQSTTTFVKKAGDVMTGFLGVQGASVTVAYNISASSAVITYGFSAGSAAISGNLTASSGTFTGNVSATAFAGDGSKITNLPASGSHVGIASTTLGSFSFTSTVFLSIATMTISVQVANDPVLCDCSITSACGGAAGQYMNYSWIIDGLFPATMDVTNGVGRYPTISTGLEQYVASKYLTPALSSGIHNIVLMGKSQSGTLTDNTGQGVEQCQCIEQLK